MCCDGDVKVDIGGAGILNIDRNGGLSPLFHFAFLYTDEWTIKGIHPHFSLYCSVPLTTKGLS